MNVLVFDIETVPDVAGGRRLFGLEGLDDNAAAEAMFNLRRQETGNDFLRHHLQRIVAISAVFRSRDQIAVWTLGDEQADEKTILEKFFHLIERYSPTLVSWNGSGFDLPVLHYRALVHGVASPRYWDQGHDDKNFKWNNYLSRYHDRHTDLMDLMALYNNRAFVPLDQMAALLGFPGKMGMSGAKVWDAFQQGDIKGIRDYCETDVLNTWLVYLRFQLIRGVIMDDGYQAELNMVKDYLRREARPHFTEFLQHWEGVTAESSEQSSAVKEG
ncbi:3'-5' exonuclease [Ketobacter alkanivorans]|uniref:3'-5' exonuclease n=1 Tax=Ketobacter alkanivorans TaxID=1917421 RepID=A0A2K9LHF1_9GAMM|nr:3'-5' exonuclease [Ketobacter alkanivorans]AUM11779.1 3'-5' exonuclease [Ketobacter alkanivorans]MCP5014357.1 3'-5' exonuclease [Ketobacter sp.]